MKTKTRIGIAAALLLGAGTAVVMVKTHGGDGDGGAAGAARGARAPGRPAHAPPGGSAAADAPPPVVAPDARPLALVTARAEVDPTAIHGAVEGRVVDWATGAPVASADITLALPDESTTTLASDRDGRFRFAPDVPQRVTIASITAAGYLPFAPEWGHSPIELVARPGIRVRDIVVYLTPAIDYTGVVLAADGTPVAGATVRLIDLPAAEQEIVSIEDRFTTDRKGEFVFHAPDEALLEARAAGHGPGRARLDGAAQTSHRLAIRLAASGEGDELGSASLAGVVVDAGGDPVPGALVRAEPVRRRGQHGDANLVAAARAVAGDDGRFAMAGLDPGDYLVGAQDGERAPASAKVTLAARARGEVRLELATGAVLVGTVRDASGDPVAACTVVVSHMDGLRGEVVAVRTIIDREGAFAIDGLAPGDYRVQATAHGHAPSQPASGRAEIPPARGSQVALTLPAGGTLTGTVRSADGAPLENARVSVEGGLGEGPTPVPFAASATTDKAGVFTLRGLSPGRRSVVVAAFDHHATILSGLEIAEGAQVGPIDVRLTPVAEGEQPTLELAGIGVQISPGDNVLVIEGVIAGGGAELAGLAAGDAILAVDGAAVTALGFDTAIQAIRGPVGTIVRLTVRKAGQATARELRVERRQIRA
jgi:protocatechuate 3,4-dioxygenase beta subunit